MARHINHRLATAPTQGQEASARSAPAREKALLPWITSLQPDRDANDGLPAYLNDAENLISADISELADHAIRERPAWMTMLGQEPATADSRKLWRRHIAVIAAYRDQHHVPADDPRQALGPYAEPGHAGNTAYWHAAESVRAARELAGLNHPNPEPRTATAPPRSWPPTSTASCRKTKGTRS